MRFSEAVLCTGFLALVEQPFDAAALNPYPRRRLTERHTISTTLVVRAGFVGPVHAREFAEVRVIDKSPHIDGDFYDYVHDCSVRNDQCRPHLIHTSNTRVVNGLPHFTEWLPYQHSAVVCLGNSNLAPKPVNLDALNNIYSIDFHRRRN